MWRNQPRGRVVLLAMTASPRLVLVSGLLVLATACAGVDAGGGGTVVASPGAGGPVPDLDTTRHDVPLEEIYFDTFDGGSVPLSESTSSLRRRLLDAIPPIDDPVYGGVKEGEWLEPDDLVLGYTAGGETYAYPFKILNFHEIVNDVIDGVPVLVSYCPLCRSGIVYDRRVGGETLEFGNTSALYESDLVMVDRNTGSYWWQVAGKAIVGPLTGTALTPLSSEVTTWSRWKMSHPGTLVLTRDTGFSRPYETDSFASYGEYLDAGRFAFPVTEASRDGRLPAAALVVAVTIDGVTAAYPVTALTGPANDVVGGSPVLVVPTGGGAAAFSRELGGSRLEFRLDGGELVDVATGSVWSHAGVALSGELAGEQLRKLPIRTTFWFAIVAAFPDVELRGG